MSRTVWDGNAVKCYWEKRAHGGGACSLYVLPRLFPAIKAAGEDLLRGVAVTRRSCYSWKVAVLGAEFPGFKRLGTTEEIQAVQQWVRTKSCTFDCFKAFLATIPPSGVSPSEITKVKCRQMSACALAECHWEFVE